MCQDCSLVEEVVSAVLAVEAKRRVDPEFSGVTFFSAEDVWLFQEVLDARVCPECRAFAETNTFQGNHLRLSFPYLEIIDVDTIKANVHPNCRCYLIRYLGES